MVIADAAYGAEPSKIVLVGIIEAVPCYDVERSVVLLGCEKMTSKFGEKGPFRIGVLIEMGHWSLEVAGIGQAVGANRS